MQSRIKAHLKKLTQVHGDFNHEVLDKNPLDMVSGMFNLSLQQDRDAASYAKKQKITTMKEFRALVTKNNSPMVATLRAACKQEDAKQLSRAIEACIKDLTSLGAGAVPPGTYCQTPLCHSVKQPRSRGLLD